MIDEIDQKLLAVLKKDAKKKYSELAEELNLSAPSVHARVKKLEQTGVIKAYNIDIDGNLLGLRLCAFVRITTEGASNAELCEGISQFPEVEEIYNVAGEECLLLKVRTSDPAALGLLLDNLRTVKGVTKTITSVVLSVPLERGLTPRLVK
ncbi:MAG TPA: Lrp/AsnC family transcriptional regulator [Oculatellaceae cyanobacterium]